MVVRALERPKLPSKKPTSFRFSEEVWRILDELEERLGRNRTGIIEMALRQLYRRETGRTKPPEKPADPS